MSESDVHLEVEAECPNEAETAANGGGRRLPVDANLKFRFCNVSYTTKQSKSKIIKILNNTCGEFKSGRLTAILGPSGAGKTSMLNVLSGFKANGVTGQFLLNGKARKLMTFRKMSSYIPQDFAMLDLLTVEESIKVSTDLKLPAKTSPAEKKKIMNDILNLLNMNNCRHTLVGNISGGERKRLSIAIELVTNPPIMFFDEPTSGLDSVASLQIINYLRRLASDGRIIVCVVHQPSSRLINFFDDIMVMSRGEILYCGSQRDMLPQFEKSGFICPQYYNPADFVLEVGSEEHDEKIKSLIERNKENYCLKAPLRMVDENTNLLSHTDIEMKDIAEADTVFCSKSNLSVMRPKTHVSVFRQLVVLMRRQILSMSRNVLSVQLRVIMHVVVGVLLGFVFWNVGNDGAKTLTNSSCIFFMVMFVFFGNAMPSILLCPQDVAVFIREYFNGWYSVNAYYISKIIADIPLQFMCPTIFSAIVYYMTGQPNDIGRFVMCWGISLLTATIAHFLGLVIGSTFDMQMAVFLVPSISIPFLIFSGFFIRIHELTPILRPLCDISYFRYTMEGFMQAIYGYDRPDLTCNIDFCYFKSPQKFLKELGMWDSNYGEDILVLFIWIIILKVLFYFSLLLRIKKAQ